MVCIDTCISLTPIHGLFPRAPLVLVPSVTRSLFLLTLSLAFVRLHSAGHLLDAALRNLGRGDLVPDKGYHFPDGPYVEYVGAIEEGDREALVARLNEEVERLIAANSSVVIRYDDTSPSPTGPGK